MEGPPRARARARRRAAGTQRTPSALPGPGAAPAAANTGEQQSDARTLKIDDFRTQRKVKLGGPVYILARERVSCLCTLNVF